jgi:DNA-binding PadR family transcriptional regulator
MKVPAGALVDVHLPLRPVACAVLAALADGPKIGVDILESVNTTMSRSPLLGPGTLYRLLRELRQQSLIVRTAHIAEDADERHAPHGLTPLGQAVLDADLERLRRTLTLAARPKQA